MTQLSVIAWVIVLDIAPLWMLGFMLFSSFYGFFQHANVNYRWMRRIEWLMTTPRTHCIHHFIDPRFSCCNLGAITNIWDRVFGTFVDPETVPDLIERKLGVAGKSPMVRTALGV